MVNRLEWPSAIDAAVSVLLEPRFHVGDDLECPSTTTQLSVPVFVGSSRQHVFSPPPIGSRYLLLRVGLYPGSIALQNLRLEFHIPLMGVLLHVLLAPVFVLCVPRSCGLDAAGTARHPAFAFPRPFLHQVELGERLGQLAPRARFSRTDSQGPLPPHFIRERAVRCKERAVRSVGGPPVHGRKKGPLGESREGPGPRRGGNVAAYVS
jgi:hypothetical protein